MSSETVNKTYTVTFDLNYSSNSDNNIYKTLSVIAGNTVDTPTAPIRENYIFEGWYITENGGEKFNFDTVIIKNITLYAQWRNIDIIDTNKLCTLSFNLNYNGGENTIEKQIIKFGSIAKEPDDPTRDNYVFDGWYLDDSYSEYFNFDSTITKDTILFAKWIEKNQLPPFTITQEECEHLNYELYGDLKSGTANLDLSFGGQAISNVKVEYQLKQGNGNVAITPINTGNSICNTAGLIGTPIDIHLIGNATLESSKVIFSFDESNLPSGVNASSLSVAWYDPEEGIMKLVDSFVDSESKTITFETSHFSEYCIVDTNQWFENWNKEQFIIRDTDNIIDNTHFNVIFVLDTSSSMSDSAIEAIRIATNTFISELMEEDYISIISFNSSSSILVSPCSIKDNQIIIQNALNSLNSSGGTDFNEALNTVIQVFSSDSWKYITDDSVQNIVVFMSDGQSTVSNNILQSYSCLDATTISVGVGNGVKKAELEKIANASKNGKYVYCDSANDLIQIFEQIQAENIGSTKDTDGDGLPDIVEINGMRDQFGYINYTDPYNADTDGDGFSDGYEMGTFINSSSPYFSIISSPTTPTYISDEVKVSLVGEPHKEILKTDNFSDFSAFSTRKFVVRVESKRYDMAWDYLNDVIYTQPENFTISTDSSDIEISNIVVTQRSTSGYAQIWNISFDVHTKEDKLKDFKGSIFIKPNEGNDIKFDIDIDFYSDWYRLTSQYLENQKKRLEIDTGNIVNIVDKNIEKQENSFNNTIHLSATNAPKDVTEWLNNLITTKLKEQIEINHNNLFKSTEPSDIVNDCWKILISDKSIQKPTIGNTQYIVTINELGIAPVSFFRANIEEMGGKRNSYVYGAVNDQKSILKAVEDYGNMLLILLDSSLKECIAASFKDSAEVLLGFNDIPKLVKAWTGTKTSKYISDVLKAAGIKYGSGMLLDKVCDSFKRTDKRINQTSHTFIDDVASINDIEDVSDYIELLLKAYEEFLKIP